MSKLLVLVLFIFVDCAFAESAQSALADSKNSDIAVLKNAENAESVAKKEESKSEYLKLKEEELQKIQNPEGVGVLKSDNLPPSMVKEGKPLKKAVIKTPMSLLGAIDASLRGNLDLVYSRFEPEKMAQNIEIEDAVFSPKITASLTYTDNKDARSSSTLEGAATPESNNFTYNVGVSKKFSFGTEVRVYTNATRNETNSLYSTLNPEYNAKLGLEITQPILKGAGETVNLAPIVIAKSHRRESDLQLKKKILDTLLNAEVAYWNLSTAYAFRDLKQSNLELAQGLLAENKVKFNVGLIRKQDVLQAEANLALAEEAIITANQLIEKNNDELLGSFGRLEFDNNPVFSVSVLPQEEIAVPDFETVVKGAVDFDLDLQIAMEAIERNKLEVIVADDNVNPTLNLRAGGAMLGREGEFGESYKNSAKAKGYSWNAGFDFIMPWGFKSEKASSAKAKITLRQADVRLTNVRQDLMLSVRLAYRDLEAGLESRRSAARTLALNEESFAQQKALYDVGLVTFRDVLQAQKDLDESKSRYLDSVYNVMIARAKLSRLDGSILKRYGFTWDWLETFESAESQNISTSQN